MFCPLGQNELDIKKCDAQIPNIIKNLRSPNKVRGNNRWAAVIWDTLIIARKPDFSNCLFLAASSLTLFKERRRNYSLFTVFRSCAPLNPDSAYCKNNAPERFRNAQGQILCMSIRLIPAFGQPSILRYMKPLSSLSSYSKLMMCSSSRVWSK